MIYSGLGPIALVIFLFFLFLADQIAEQVYGPRFEFFRHPFVPPLTFFLAGLAVWILGRLLNKKKVRTMELQHGEEVVVERARHTIFFVPMEYWGILFFVLFTCLWITR
jgi:hypothetical protein